MSEVSDCVFCGIVGGVDEEIVVYRDEVAVGFLDHSPLFVGHVLIVPTTHVVTLADLPAELVGPFFRRVQQVSARLPSIVGAEGTFVANNNVVSQSVAHLHVHVAPRTRGDGLRGFFWPRRRYEPGQAASTAARLRRELADFEDT